MAMCSPRAALPSAWRLTVGDPKLTGEFDALSLTEEECTDEVLLHTWIPNADGSVTAWGIINFYGPNHETFSGDIKVRLRSDDAADRRFARSKRRETLAVSDD